MGKSKARKAQERAEENEEISRAQMDAYRKDYQALEFKNPYLNQRNYMSGLTNVYSGLENTMEDLTINQKQAEFERQQFQQSQANILGGLRGAAGGSGVAALAQALSQQGQIAGQRAAASIGQQEARNQAMAAQQAAKLQSQEAAYSGQLQQDYKDKSGREKPCYNKWKLTELKTYLVCNKWRQLVTLRRLKTGHHKEVKVGHLQEMFLKLALK